MADRITKEQRSKIMSSIKGKGNKSTELKMVSLFKENGITGWRRHQKIHGTPDFVFQKQKVAVFVDGCFWHGCKKCSNLKPNSNKEFWSKKIEQNLKRDKKINQALKQKGWTVIRFWEHELKKTPQTKLKKIYAKSWSK